MKKIVSVCIIGGNYGLKVLLPAISRIKNVIVKAVAVKNVRSNQKVILYYSWKKMIKECKPDLVLVAVPPKLQSNILSYLINNNVNFLAQKPLTYNFNDAKKIFHKFNKKNIKAAVDLNFLKIPAISKYKKVLKKYTDLRSSIEVKWLFKSGTLKEKKSWKNIIKDGGGSYLNFGFHLISLIIYLFGDIKYLKRYNRKNKVDYLKGKTKKGQSLKIKFSNDCISENIFSIKSTTTKKKSLVLENRSANYHGNFIIYNKNNFKKKNIIFKDIPQNSNNSRIVCSRLVIKDLIKSFYKKNYSLFNDLEHAVKVHQIISNI
jgi:predicted dehydrogenase